MKNMSYEAGIAFVIKMLGTCRRILIYTDSTKLVMNLSKKGGAIFVKLFYKNSNSRAVALQKL